MEGLTYERRVAHLDALIERGDLLRREWTDGPRAGAPKAWDRIATMVLDAVDAECGVA